MFRYLPLNSGPRKIPVLLDVDDSSCPRKANSNALQNLTQSISLPKTCLFDALLRYVLECCVYKHYQVRPGD